MSHPADNSDWLIVFEHHPAGSKTLSLLKTYCALIWKTRGAQESIANACPDHQIMILNGSGRSVVEQSMGRNRTLLFQPSGTGTAQAIYLALAVVCRENHDAFVTICPSDRLSCLDSQLSLGRIARELRNRVVLLGTFDDSLSSDESLIETAGYVGRIEGQDVWMVNQFLPVAGPAKPAADGDVYWNTSIVAAQAQTLWALGWQRFPELMEFLEEYLALVGDPESDEGLKNEMNIEPSSLSFNSDLIGSFPWQTVMVEYASLRRPARALSERTQALFTKLDPDPLLQPD